MINLLLLDEPTSNLNITSFGDRPVHTLDNPLNWPTCTACGGEMQYLGRIKTDLGLEQIFMCQNDPGMCEEWEADAGGNRVIIVGNGQLRQFSPQDTETGLRRTAYGAKIIGVEADGYSGAIASTQAPDRAILGCLGGEPEWWQGNQTPDCVCCGKPMRFVAQLEEGPDHRTAMNFGGGIGYLFDCPVGRTGKFLWQC